MSDGQKGSTPTNKEPREVLSPGEEEVLRRLGQIDQAAFDVFVNEFRNESDRAAVILGAAKLDDLLRRMLDRFLLPDPHKKHGLLGDGGDEPLSTFSARTRAAFRLGLIDEEFALSLGEIRKIRNGFAHNVEARSLADEPYRTSIKRITWPIPSPTFWKFHIESYAQAGPSAEFRAVLVVLALILEQSINLVSTVRPRAILPTMSTIRWRGGQGRPGG